MIGKIRKVAPSAIMSVFLMNILSTRVAAQNPLEGWLDGIISPGDDLLTWVQSALNLAIGLSALVAVAVLIYGGIMYITSAGDEGKIETATKAITYSIIGLVICFISVLIVNFVLEYVIGGGTA